MLCFSTNEILVAVDQLGITLNKEVMSITRVSIALFIQWYTPIKIIGIKIIVSTKSEKSLRLMVHISETLTKSLR